MYFTAVSSCKHFWPVDSEYRVEFGSDSGCRPMYVSSERSATVSYSDRRSGVCSERSATVSYSGRRSGVCSERSETVSYSDRRSGVCSERSETVSYSGRLSGLVTQYSTSANSVRLSPPLCCAPTIANRRPERGQRSRFLFEPPRLLQRVRQEPTAG